MTTDTISQTVLFPNLFDKPLLAQFDQPHTSSDGGAVLLKAAETGYGLVAGFVRCLAEPGGSSSTSIRPTTARMAPSSCRSSTATTTLGATCRCWRS